MNIREMTAGDRAPLAALLAAIEQFKPDEVEVALELVDTALRDGPASGYTCLIAREDGPAGALLGYICVGPTPMTQATWDLYWIAVAPARQGGGIGHKLYEAALGRIRARGGRQLRIETSSKESYAKTGGFYERLGFSVDGRLRDFYDEGDDLLIFYQRIA